MDNEHRVVDTGDEEVAGRLARENEDFPTEPNGGQQEAREARQAEEPAPDGEGEALDRPRPDGALERRDGVEPDVLLHVPTLKVEEISVEVDELEARVALHAEVANLVKLDVGADVGIGRVKIEIKGVEAAALLKVRLEEVYKILERTLTTIDNNPQLLESLLKPVGEAVGQVGKGVGQAAPELGKGVGETASQATPAAGEAVDQVAGEAGSAVGQATGNSNQQGEGKMGDERGAPETGGKTETPLSFDKLKSDLMKVAQDIGDLLKEGLGEPGGKGLLGQVSRLAETMQEWKQEQEAKKAEKKAGSEAKPSEEKPEAGAKPSEEKPEAEAKPSEEKPEAEAKPSEEKPEAEAKPSEEKPEAEAKPSEEKPEGGPMPLFDGSEESFGKWQFTGSGKLDCEGGQLCLEAGDDLGLAYYEQGKLDAGTLRMQFCPEGMDYDACVVVRFRNPNEAVPDRENPETKYNYDNPAYVAPHTGFAVQLASDRPRAEPGTFDGVLFGDAPGAQAHPERGEIREGEWNEVEVDFEGDCYSVRLNGTPTARFVNVDSYRGKSSEEDPASGFVGLLLRKGRIRLKEVSFEAREAEAAEAPEKGEEAGQEASP